MKNLSRDTKLAIGILVLLVVVTTFAALQRETRQHEEPPRDEPEPGLDEQEHDQSQRAPDDHRADASEFAAHAFRSARGSASRPARW